MLTAPTLLTAIYAKGTDLLTAIYANGADDDDEVMLNVLGCRLTYIRDKLRPMPKHGSINLYVH